MKIMALLLVCLTLTACSRSSAQETKQLEEKKSPCKVKQLEALNQQAEDIKEQLQRVEKKLKK